MDVKSERLLFWWHRITFVSNFCYSGVSFALLESVPVDVNALYEVLHDSENALKLEWRREPLEKWFREYGPVR